MSTLNASVKLTAYDAAGTPLGDLQCSGGLPTPVLNPIDMLPLSGALRDTLRQLWSSHYATTDAVAKWTVTLQAELDGRAFEDVRMEDLPLNFNVNVLPMIQGLLENALAALTA